MGRNNGRGRGRGQGQAQPATPPRGRGGQGQVPAPVAAPALAAAGQAAVGAVNPAPDLDPKLVREARRDVDKQLDKLVVKMREQEFTGEMSKFDGKLHVLIDTVRAHASQIFWEYGDNLPDIDIAVHKMMTAKAAASAFKQGSPARDQFTAFWSSYVPVTDEAMPADVDTVPGQDKRGGGQARGYSV